MPATHHDRNLSTIPHSIPQLARQAALRVQAKQDVLLDRRSKDAEIEALTRKDEKEAIALRARNLLEMEEQKRCTQATTQRCRRRG